MRHGDSVSNDKDAHRHAYQVDVFGTPQHLASLKTTIHGLERCRIVVGRTETIQPAHVYDRADRRDMSSEEMSELGRLLRILDAADGNRHGFRSTTGRLLPLFMVVHTCLPRQPNASSS